MDRINVESFGFDCPPFADELVWRETFERLEATAEIVSVDEILEVSAQLVVVVVVEALDGCILDGAIHPFDLAVHSWMARLCQAMLNVEIGTCRLKGMTSVRHVLGPHGLGCPTVTCRIGDMGANVGENRMDFIGSGCDQRPEAVARDPAGGLLDQLRKGEFGCPVNGHKEKKPAFSRLHFGDINVKIAYRVALELLLRLLVAHKIRQA